MAEVQVEARARARLAQLTLEEKASLLDGRDFWHTKPVERLGVPALTVSDGPHGLRKQANLGDPIGLNASVQATCFPPAVALACSWDPQLARRVGEALGDECRAADVAVLLGPGINMKRSPLCGRNFEYFSEDPLLAGAMASGWVQGVQSRGVGTSLKHFAANNQEAERLRVSAEVDERTLREIYLAAFEQVVRAAQPWTVMCSYNRINGVYASEHHWLLTEVLRQEWGFEGLVVSDWGAVNRRDHGVAAGLDLEMPSSGGAGTQVILEALREGTLSEQQLDRAVLRVLELVDRAAAREPLEEFDQGAHHALAREAAAASIVLLKNDQRILPLDPAQGGAIAVIGEFARSPRFQGAGSSQVSPTRVENALHCLREALAGSRELLFAPGFELESEALDPQLAEQAVAAAAQAQVALVFLGLPPTYESEGYDREHMRLPDAQLQLLERVAAANPNVVVVLSNGSAVLVADWEHHARAVVEGWLLGQAGGAAICDVLLGAVSPSGRLAETIPQRFEHNPALGNFPGSDGVVRYGEGLLIGYRWYDTRALPVAHPFGHGLSYTSFEYSDLQVRVLDDGAEPRVEVSLRVTNSGQRSGAEVVQLYVSAPRVSVFGPEQELRGFARVQLDPGAAELVTLTLEQRAFAHWHVARAQWAVEGGEYELRVGASSRDIRLRAGVTLRGGQLAAPLGPDSTLAEFLADDAGREWLLEKFGGSALGDRVLESEMTRMLGSFPVRRLARFPGAAFGEAELDGFLAAR